MRTERPTNKGFKHDWGKFGTLDWCIRKQANSEQSRTSASVKCLDKLGTGQEASHLVVYDLALVFMKTHWKAYWAAIQLIRRRCASLSECLRNHMYSGLLKTEVLIYK